MNSSFIDVPKKNLWFSVSFLMVAVALVLAFLTPKYSQPIFFLLGIISLVISNFYFSEYKEIRKVLKNLQTSLFNQGFIEQVIPEEILIDKLGDDGEEEVIFGLILKGQRFYLRPKSSGYTVESSNPIDNIEIYNFKIKISEDQDFTVIINKALPPEYGGFKVFVKNSFKE